MGQPIAASLGRNREVLQTQTALLPLNYFMVLIHIARCQHLIHPQSHNTFPNHPVSSHMLHSFYTSHDTTPRHWASQPEPPWAGGKSPVRSQWGPSHC